MASAEYSLGKHKFCRWPIFEKYLVEQNPDPQYRIVGYALEDSKPVTLENVEIVHECKIRLV